MLGVFLLGSLALVLLLGAGLLFRQPRMLGMTAAELALEDAKADDLHQSVRGQRDGLRVVVRFTHRERGATSAKWTEVDVYPAPLRCRLHVRTRSLLDTGLAAQGLVAEVQTGDAALDEAFIVEGAPRDVVLAALDASTRQAILELDPRHAGGVEMPNQSQLRVHREGWIEDDLELAQQIDLAVALAGRLAEAERSIEAADRRPGETPTYRNAYDPAKLEAKRARRKAELADMLRLTALRSSAGWRSGMLLGVALVITVLTLLVIAMMR